MSYALDMCGSVDAVRRRPVAVRQMAAQVAAKFDQHKEILHSIYSDLVNMHTWLQKFQEEWPRQLGHSSTTCRT